MDLRMMEAAHHDDIRRLWIRLAALTGIVALLLGDMHLLTWILEVLP